MSEIPHVEFHRQLPKMMLPVQPLYNVASQAVAMFINKSRLFLAPNFDEGPAAVQPCCGQRG